MSLQGATIIDNALGGRRGKIVTVNAEAGTVLVLWPRGGYNEVDARREPGRYSVEVPS
jgi:hypothetical protein